MNDQPYTEARHTPDISWSTRALYGLLVVQMIVGFEFFWSVLAKFVRGGFVSGLQADLQDRVQAAPSWYRSFAESVVIPHATVFAYLIIVGEVFVGVGLIAAAAVWLARWPRISDRARFGLIVLSGAAALAGLAMNINYHIASGMANPWQIADSAFDEAVDLNSILSMTELTILAVMVAVGISLRRTRRQNVPASE